MVALNDTEVDLCLIPVQNSLLLGQPYSQALFGNEAILGTLKPLVDNLAPYGIGLDQECN